jgi:hypothetical protein
MRLDDRQFSGGLVDSYAWLHPTNHIADDRAHFVLQFGSLIFSQWCDQLHLVSPWKGEVGWKDAHNYEWTAVKDNRLSNDSWIRSEPLLPQCVSEQSDLITPFIVFLLNENCGPEPAALQESARGKRMLSPKVLPAAHRYRSDFGFGSYTPPSQ